MDLRSIINNEAGESSISKQPAPVTPVQAHPTQGFRDYSHPPQASPGKHPSQDYGAQPGGQPYPSPSTYQSNYQGRPPPPPPPPPPIQAPPQNDLRSPARSYSAQSPYQQTPSSATSQYPFPQTQSPAQHHQYPPSLQQRDSYSQVNPPPHLQHHNSYSQASPAPQTPPIGIPGAPHPYLQQHQRSASSSTPTSAHSQQQYFNQFPQESPVSTSHFPPSQLPPHQRQPSVQSQHSQPGTPLGPPLSQRQSSGAFAQPSSPYQQRGVSTGPFNHFQQTSPAPAAPASLPRLSSTSSAYDSQRTSMSEQQRRSQSERERSVSVSPKTRLPSHTPRAESIPQSENGYNNPAKRTIEDREVPVEEPRLMDQPVNRTEVNGDHRIMSLSPQQPPKKRVRYTEPPIWAQSVKNKGAFPPANRAAPKVNGKQAQFAPPPPPIPAPIMPPQVNGNRQVSVSPVIVRSGPPAPPASHPSILLGPWEESITGKKPYEQMTKLVADFIYVNVVNRGDLGELASRGIEIEIEAKLGQLINKDTNQRIQIPVLSECILADNRNIGFRSSMTEAQHKSLNEFLNARVAETHPNNPQMKKRVPIDYLHRREIDKFYDLPPALLSTIPPVVRKEMKPHHGVKVRVTYDLKTTQLLSKIIKVRLVNLDVYNPTAPLDFRISINFEMRYDGDIEELIRSETSPDRSKDRLSYSQSHYQIDLTQVTQTTSANGGTRTDKEHELEIELSAEAVRDQGRKAGASQPNEYLSLVEGMIDNVRVLQRNVPPP